MRAPQAPQVRGSASNIFRTKRAHVLRASLENSALSRWSAVLAASAPAPAAGALASLPRFEYAP
jgi:hypothetical protein